MEAAYFDKSDSYTTYTTKTFHIWVDMLALALALYKVAMKFAASGECVLFLDNMRC